MVAVGKLQARPTAGSQQARGMSTPRRHRLTEANRGCGISIAMDGPGVGGSRVEGRGGRVEVWSGGELLS